MNRDAEIRRRLGRGERAVAVAAAMRLSFRDVRQVERAMAAERATAPPPAAPPPPATCTCPLCEGAGRIAADAILASEEEVMEQQPPEEEPAENGLLGELVVPAGHRLCATCEGAGIVRKSEEEIEAGRERLRAICERQGVPLETLHELVAMSRRA